MPSESAANPPATDLPLEASSPQPVSSAPESHHTVIGMEDFNPEDCDPRPIHRPPLSRVLLVLAILAGLAALIFVPPLVSMNHYRRQIASSISASLGRPVRIDSVALNLFPMPGFTLKNFVVDEDPAFGSEPIIRANSVTATLRFSSLWRRRMEFARISLDSPSVNLVRLPDGRWNLESILLHTSHVQAAPTAQARPGNQPRFPYIEATGGRVNLKSGLEKLPISLTDASFALWLPQPDEWQLRIEALPTRTDAAATDTGTLRVEGSLGRAHQLQNVPVNLTASWDGAPLGGASRVLLGQDEDVRGDLSLHVSVAGTAGDNVITSELQVNGLRRADFVPDHSLSIHLRCGARALALFHQMDEVRCVWPVSDGNNGLVIAGRIPDVTNPAAAQGYGSFKSVPASGLLGTLKAASPRVSRDLQAGGVAFGSLRYGEPEPAPVAAPDTTRRHTNPAPAPEAGAFPLFGTVGITRATLTAGQAAPFVKTEIAATVSGGEMKVLPFPVDLGGPTPAMLSMRMDRNGYQLHLVGPVLRSRLALLSRELPQFGDGLTLPALPSAGGAGTAEPVKVEEQAKTVEPVRVDLDASRTWRGGQTWTSAAPAQPAPHRNRHAVRVSPATL